MQRQWLLTMLFIGFAALSLLAPLGEEALKIHDQAFERSVGAFAIAKGLNAVISLLQGTELNATPAGIGVTITFGQILDPMNDLIERFSWIMLASSVSLGVQKLLLSIGELLWIKIALSTLAVLLLTALWYVPLQRKLPLTTLLRLAVVLLLLRFGAVGFVYAENFVYVSMMQSQYQESVTILSNTQDELDTIAAQNKHQAVAPQKESFFDSLSGSYNRFKRFFDVETRLQALQSQLEEAQNEVLNLITLFVTLNLLLPLLFFWIILNLFKWAITGRFDGDAIQRWFTPRT